MKKLLISVLFLASILSANAATQSGAITFGSGLTLQPASGSSTYTLTLPATAGSNLQFLQTDGSGTTTWAGGGSGTVTSIATTSPISGGTITTTGTLSLLANVDFAFTNLQTVTVAPAANTEGDALRLYDTTAASSGNQQYSGALHFQGQGWKTTATAASQAVDFREYVVPVQGTANPTGYLIRESSINGGAYGHPIIFFSSGGMSLGSTTDPGAQTIYGDTSTPNLVLSNGNGATLSYGSSSQFFAGGSASISNGGVNCLQINSTVNALRSAGILAWTNIANAGGSTWDTGFARNVAGLVEVNNGTAGTFRDLKVRQHYVDATLTGSGTTGNQTINKAAGSVRIAAAGTSVTVTDNLVTANSIILGTIATNDATAVLKNIVASAGSFVITLNAAATAETEIRWVVINQ